ncbi:MAG TPA: zinc ABC transporter substrate-binding protein, partial [Phycisphaerae bacterium]|nr:zinc ABC transporter substrate-binding protein [Phycisphaerae bacterium]
MSKKLILLTLFIAMIPIGCGGSDEKSETQADVFVSVGPLAWLAERIAGEHLDVGTILAPGQDPHTFAPSAKQILALSRGKIFFTVKLPLETTVAHKISSSSKTLKIVDLTAEMDLIKDEHDHDHDHGNCTASVIDPHIWTSPRLSKELARKMCEEFCLIKPECKDIFQANLAALVADLDKLDEKLSAILAPYKG